VPSGRGFPASSVISLRRWGRSRTQPFHTTVVNPLLMHLSITAGLVSWVSILKWTGPRPGVSTIAWITTCNRRQTGSATVPETGKLLAIGL
jgi:hypothetical protein